jgi:hypothetical protein
MRAMRKVAIGSGNLQHLLPLAPASLLRDGRTRQRRVTSTHALSRTRRTAFWPGSAMMLRRGEFKSLSPRVKYCSSAEATLCGVCISGVRADHESRGLGTRCTRRHPIQSQVIAARAGLANHPMVVPSFKFLPSAYPRNSENFWRTA